MYTCACMHGLNHLFSFECQVIDCYTYLMDKVCKELNLNLLFFSVTFMSSLLQYNPETGEYRGFRFEFRKMQGCNGENF
jgi:hypothetical protein